MSTVFISYRREENAGDARALCNDLGKVLGTDSVFMDVDSIALGRDFREALKERLASSDLMLVLIGKGWIDAKDAAGKNRLDQPDDFVRQEIATALKRNIPVTPVLLHGATVPRVEQLPEDLRDLAFRNGFELSYTRWQSDIGEMIKRLGLAADQAPRPPQPIAQVRRGPPGDATGLSRSAHWRWPPLRAVISSCRPACQPITRPGVRRRLPGTRPRATRLRPAMILLHPRGRMTSPQTALRAALW